MLGGYLGSGKTTWLRHQLHDGRFADAVVIVNEAAETPVDDALLGQCVASSTVLAGGCACCDDQGRARRAAPHALRRAQPDRLRRASVSSSIVLETSGLADPGPIVEAIRTDPVLVHHIVVSEIVVLVDARPWPRASSGASRSAAARSRSPTGSSSPRSMWPTPSDAAAPARDAPRRQSRAAHHRRGQGHRRPPAGLRRRRAGARGRERTASPARRSSRPGFASTPTSTGRPSPCGSRRSSTRAATTCCASRAWCGRRPAGSCCRACARWCSRRRSCPSMRRARTTPSSSSAAASAPTSSTNRCAISPAQERGQA